MKPHEIRELRDMLARLDGAPPYNVPSNIVMADPYYARSIEKKFGNLKIEDLRKLAGAGSSKNFEPQVGESMQFITSQIKERIETLERQLNSALSIIGSVTGSNRKDWADGVAYGHTCCFGIDMGEAQVLEMAHQQREEFERLRDHPKA